MKTLIGFCTGIFLATAASVFAGNINITPLQKNSKINWISLKKTGTFFALEGSLDPNYGMIYQAKTVSLDKKHHFKLLIQAQEKLNLNFILVDSMGQVEKENYQVQ